MDDGDLTLIAGGQSLSGWTFIRVTAGIERFPRDFEIGMTELFPGELAAVSVKPGDPCTVKIGTDTVITGYVDGVLPSITARQHSIRVIGRGKCQDLIDASAEWPSNQIMSSDVLSIAGRLSKPYGITVAALDPVGAPIPQLPLQWGTSVYNVLEQICRYKALLVYEGPEGQLLLARAGTAAHASGFAEGKNVERAAATFRMDERYSEYVVRMMNFSIMPEIQTVGDIIEIVADKAVPRHRRLYIIAESGDTPDYSIAKQRGLWEAARRAGRSFNVQITTDSWRDQAGMLWTPNQLAPIDLPTLKIMTSWLIGEVTFRRDAAGTHADLLLMPKEAFMPEPFLLTPIFRDVASPPTRTIDRTSGRT